MVGSGTVPLLDGFPGMYRRSAVDDTACSPLPAHHTIGKDCTGRAMPESSWSTPQGMWRRDGGVGGEPGPYALGGYPSPSLQGRQRQHATQQSNLCQNEATVYQSTHVRAQRYGGKTQGRGYAQHAVFVKVVRGQVARSITVIRIRVI